MQDHIAGVDRRNVRMRIWRDVKKERGQLYNDPNDPVFMIAYTDNRRCIRL